MNITKEKSINIFQECNEFFKNSKNIINKNFVCINKSNENNELIKELTKELIKKDEKFNYKGNYNQIKIKKGDIVETAFSIDHDKMDFCLL